MSNGLQNKMYNYEVAPPAGVWEKIAPELDESLLSHKFPSKLHNIQITPPLHVWQNIAGALSESAMVNDYAGKLSGIEVIPPATVWNNIKNSLNAENEIAVSQRRRIPSFLKYAAAAALIGFLAWGSIQLINNKSADTTITNQEIQPEENTNSVAITAPDENIGVNNVTAALEEARNNAALEASKKTYARLDASVVTGSKIKNAANFYFDDDSYATRGLNIAPEELQITDIANRYILLMTPDGNIIRMSKKLGGLVCCVSGEEQDKDCVDQMKKWRDKIAQPSTANYPGNFMDIVSLVNSLQDN